MHFDPEGVNILTMKQEGTSSIGPHCDSVCVRDLNYLSASGFISIFQHTNTSWVHININSRRLSGSVSVYLRSLNTGLWIVILYKTCSSFSMQILMRVIWHDRCPCVFKVRLPLLAMARRLHLPLIPLVRVTSSHLQYRTSRNNKRNRDFAEISALSQMIYLSAFLDLEV